MQSSLHVPCHTDGSAFRGFRVGSLHFIFTKDHEKGLKKRIPMTFVGTCKHVEGEVQEPFSENQQNKPQSLRVASEISMPMSTSR